MLSNLTTTKTERYWPGEPRVESVGGLRSLEDPSVSLSDPAAYDYLGAGGDSSSGMTVNRRTALGYAAFWRGVNLISGDVAKLPLTLYKREADGGKDRDVLHPSYRLMRRRPNTFTKVFDFKRTLIAHALSEQGGYAYIFRDGSAMPRELLILDPDVTHLVREGGKLWYVTQIIRSDGMPEPRRLPHTDVLHIRGLSFDGLDGYRVLSLHRETLGLGMAARKYGSVYFRNNGRPGVVLEHPKHLSKEGFERVKEAFEIMHQGIENAHRTAILEDGMKAHVLADNARQSQLTDVRIFEIREIANLLGIPPHMLGDPNAKSHSSIEVERREYLDSGLDVWLCQMEDECTEKLLTERQKREDTHFFEFNRAALLRADMKTETESLVMEVNNGLLTPDEARKIKNRPKIPNGEGEKFRIPANIKIVGDEPEPEPDPEPPPETIGVTDEDERQRRKLLRRTLESILKESRRKAHDRIASQACRRAKRPDSFLRWVEDQLEADNRPVFEEEFDRLLRAIACVDESFNADVVAYAGEYFDNVREALLVCMECQPDELPSRVKAWSRGREDNDGGDV